MLTDIEIRDFITIASIHLELTKGCTMLTGETGAGKSIFIEAIDIGLGGKSSTDPVRNNAEKAEITLVFDVTFNPDVEHILKKYEINDEHHCIIRRVLTKDGRSKSYINNTIVPLSVLKEIAPLLFHLHSQHEQQLLQKSEAQRNMLDRYAEHIDAIQAVKKSALLWKENQTKFEQLKRSLLEKNNQVNYLRFQLQEMDAIALEPDAITKLEEAHQRAVHIEKIKQAIQTSLEQFSDYNSSSLYQNLTRIKKTLDPIRTREPKANEWLNSLNSILTQLNDLGFELENYINNDISETETIEQIETKLTQIHELSRKHKIEPKSLYDLRNKMQGELESILEQEGLIQKLQNDALYLRERYTEEAAILSHSRKHFAALLESEITQTLKSLSIPFCEFKINLIQEDLHCIKPEGNEKIEFLMKTNPDDLLKPVVKIASGGELSRLSLALHLALAQKTQDSTLIFDEVDSGVSGKTAEKIGKLLRKLGEHQQIFCITHLPQVAVFGHAHLLVIKKILNNITYTDLRFIKNHEKTQEIARLLAGEKITNKTLAHAEELVTSIS